MQLHGWQDNASTFDPLIPLLSSEFSYLSVDFPGHGLSSQLPHGMQYTVTNCIHVLNYIRLHYKWNKLSICAHSTGALVSTLYASLYPDRCDLLVAIDAIMKPYEGSYIPLIQSYGDDFISLDAKNETGAEPPTYTYEEIISRWAKQCNITVDGVEYLAKRGIVQSKKDPNRYYFIRDIRLKLMDFGRSIPDEAHYKLIERITAPHLFIKAGKTKFYEGIQGVQRAVDILKSSNPNFEWTIADGGHHLHLDDPTLVSDRIANFIDRHRSGNSESAHKL